MGRFDVDDVKIKTPQRRDAETLSDTLTERVIGAAIEVHRVLGPGLLESAYEHCLCHELSLRDIRFTRQITLPVHYKGVEIEAAYRLDLLIENSLLIELKSLEKLQEIHKAQVLTYLRLTGYETALLINFMVPVLKDGIKRISLRRSASQRLGVEGFSR
ncbi:GxxExxY protein [Undibacterium amnicola]|uniref:GxxExxY protein n=1 Tax=Undibacterium amnicola TaxID=1834038 RepID=A0ABR6XX96_9BURK|nr:GxxExxY protein [Undibacterium amnicola]